MQERITCNIPNKQSDSELHSLVTRYQLHKCEELTVVVAAPTGLAAFNVGGLTIHRFVQLPIEHEGQMAGYWSLSKVPQKVMMTK